MEIEFTQNEGDKLFRCKLNISIEYVDFLGTDNPKPPSWDLFKQKAQTESAIANCVQEFIDKYTAEINRLKNGLQVTDKELESLIVKNESVKDIFKIRTIMRGVKVFTNKSKL